MPTASSQSSQRRENIIDEAIRLFNEKGFADTRLEDIGERLNTGKASISYHFRSKEGLLLEAYDRALTFSEKAGAKALSEASGRAAIMSWIRAHFLAHADAFRELGQPIALIADLPDIQSPEMQDVVARYDGLAQLCRTMLERGEVDHSIRISSIDASVKFILNLLNWVPRWLAELRPADYTVAVEDLLTILERGIADGQGQYTSPPSIIISTGTDPHSAFDREARNRMKRDAFLRAGTRALNQNGYRTLSLNAVAAELGVTRGAFYYHVADKEALLFGCFERSCDMIQAAQRAAKEGSYSGLAALERTLKWIFDRRISNLDPITRLNLMSALDQPNFTIIQSRLSRLRAEFAEMIARGVADGSIRPTGLSAADQIILASVFSSDTDHAIGRSTAGASTTPAEGLNAMAYYEILFFGLAGHGQN